VVSGQWAGISVSVWLQIDSRQASMYQGVSGQWLVYQIDSIRCIVFGGSVLCRCIYPSWCQVDSWQVGSR